jgi:rubrerythrin
MGFNLDDPLLEENKEEILNIDINSVTYGRSVDEINEIKRMITYENEDYKFFKERLSEFRIIIQNFFKTTCLIQ